MTNQMSINERLRLVATVSDLMLAGTVQVYMPPKRESAAVIHDKIGMAA